MSCRKRRRVIVGILKIKSLFTSSHYVGCVGDDGGDVSDGDDVENSHNLGNLSFTF